MINLLKIKESQRLAAKQGKKEAASVKKQSTGALRLQKDMTELNLPKKCKLSFPNGKYDILNFELRIRPTEGYYKSGKFVFSFQVPKIYPHEPPKVMCKTKVYHPNIDLEGNVCLNILREDWNPILTISSIIYGLLLLFSEPNYEDPLNSEAAAMLRDKPDTFALEVKNVIYEGLEEDT